MENVRDSMRDSRKRTLKKDIEALRAFARTVRLTALRIQALSDACGKPAGPKNIVINDMAMAMQKIKRLLLSVVCRFKGHKFSAIEFNTWSLCFCQRCGCELDSRTTDDLEPPAIVDNLSDCDKFVLHGSKKTAKEFFDGYIVERLNDADPGAAADIYKRMENIINEFDVDGK